jgi:membrane protein DedA with SNARE-associated domain
MQRIGRVALFHAVAPAGASAPHPVRPSTGLVMLTEYLRPVQDLLAGHPYLLIFVGLLVAGELVLLPAIHLSIAGHLQAGYVFAIAVLAIALSDLFWYGLGRRIPRPRLERIGRGRVGRTIAGIEDAFLQQGAQILVGSKFVYGTRTAVQVLCGMHRMKVQTYVLANLTGVVLLVAALFAIGYVVRGALGRMGEVVGRTEVTLLAFVVVAGLVGLLTSRLLRHRWSR